MGDPDENKENRPFIVELVPEEALQLIERPLVIEIPETTPMPFEENQETLLLNTLSINNDSNAPMNGSFISEVVESENGNEDQAKDDNMSYLESCFDYNPDLQSNYTSELNLNECGDMLNAEPLLDLVPRPPDGGYGWVIVIAAFLSNMIVDGVASSFGTLIDPFQKAFGSSKALTSLIGSLLVGSYLLVGPIVGGLVNKYGSRDVVVVGSIISAIGFFASSFSPNVYVFLFTYGLIGGIGFGCIYLPSIVMVGYYFESKRALATGIAVAGSGVGCIVMPPILTFLIKTFEWQKTLWFMSLIVLSAAFFGLLYKELYSEVDLQNGVESKKGKRIRCLLNRLCGFSLDVKTENVPEMVMTSSIVEEHINKVAVRPTASSNLGEQECPPGVDPEVYARLHSALEDSDSNAESEAAESALLRPTLSPIIESKVQHKFNSSIPSSHQLPMHPIQRTRKLTMTSISSEMTGASDIINIHLRNNPIHKISARSLYQSHGRLSQATTILSQANSSGSIALSTADSKELKRPLNRRDIFYGGSIKNLKEFDDEGRDFKSYRESQIQIPATSIAQSLNQLGNDDLSVSIYSKFGGSRMSRNTSGLACEEIENIVIEDKSKFKFIPLPIRNAFNEMIDLDLLMNKTMLLLCISNILGMLGFYVPFVFIINLAGERGVPHEQATLLLSVIGITNTVGRVFIGYMADKPWCSALIFNNFSLVFSGILMMVLPFATNFNELIVISGIFGVVVSAYICLTSIVLADLMGLDKLTNSFGLLVVSRGIACLLGTPLAGIFYDMTQSYDATFYLGGGFLVCAGLVSFSIMLIKKPIEVEPIIEEGLPKEEDNQSGKLSVLTERSEENFSEYQRTIQSLKQQQLFIAEVRRLENDLKIEENAANEEEE
uniref:MFS domain-containing protein n=1 Tax=Rhabditophanes sp. KR3021 TaxID=114890 RepID=A0AC35U6L3_9BILA